MKKLVILSILLLGLTFASSSQNITIEKLEFGTNVENREVIGADSVFANTVEKIYCFTHVTGAQDTTTITHVWYHENEEKGRVDLSVRSANWRTWSSKTILENWTGQWSVDVLGPDGEVLRTETFTVETAEEGNE